MLMTGQALPTRRRTVSLGRISRLSAVSQPGDASMLSAVSQHRSHYSSPQTKLSSWRIGVRLRKYIHGKAHELSMKALALTNQLDGLGNMKLRI